MVTTATVATTRNGKVEGREKEGVLLFAGIPYAKPPVGQLRFRAVQPHEPWSGVRPAQKFGPAAPQLAGTGLTNSVAVRWDEDCLTLNISTPAIDDRKRPVLVWIHGGAFKTGQGGTPWYNGARFAANGDIVVVSINYRLAALGFAHLARFGDDFATSGINGILDQIEALKWIRDNIEAFGGDPESVTIAGESAGAFSVGTLLASPMAAGLFQRAIAQSGAAHHGLPSEASEIVTDLLLDQLDAKTIDDLYSAPVESILEAQDKVALELLKRPEGLGTTVSPFYPTIDGGVLPKRPIDLIRDGASKDVPVVVGSNKDETTLWGAPEHIDDAGLRKLLDRLGGSPDMIDSYRRNRPDATSRDLYVAMTTDHTFRIPAIRLAEAREPHGAQTWMYHFTWESRAFNGSLKSTHALEIPFAFDNLDRGGVDVFLGEGPSPQHVADSMHAAWTSFIRTGDPGTDTLSWPAYESEHRTTMVFGDQTAVTDDPNGTEREAWAGRR